MVRSVIQTAREQFDRRFGDLRRAADAIRDVTPRAGWIRTVRTLLEMSNRSAAKRLRVSHPTLVNLEKSEESGTITLASLRKAAEALDADLVYAIVPRKKLGHMIGARSLEVAKEQVLPVAKSMSLEQQGVEDSQVRRRINALAEELQKNPRELW